MNLKDFNNNGNNASGFVDGGSGKTSGFVTEDGKVSGSGFVTEDGKVSGSGFVTENGKVSGSGFVTENGKVSGSGFVTESEYTDTLLSTNGAMSDVYVRFYHKLEFREIIKRIKPQYAHDEMYRKLFIQEFSNMKSLNHENIVKAKTQGEDSTGLWYSMEFVEGKTLQEVISQGLVTDTDAKIEILRQVLSALSYVHKSGLIHRDLKPDNIMIANRNHNVKIIDFGLAISDSFGTRLKLAGTDRYMSPEQRQNSADIDQQSDIYAFGLIMAEFLTGVFPQNANTDNIDIIQYREVVDKCLKANKQERYRNCDEILFDLRQRYNSIPDNVRQIISEIVEDGNVTLAERSRLNSLIRLHNLDENAVYALMEYELEKVREARRRSLFRKLAVIIPLLLLLGGLAAWLLLSPGSANDQKDDVAVITPPDPQEEVEEEIPEGPAQPEEEPRQEEEPQPVEEILPPPQEPQIPQKPERRDDNRQTQPPSAAYHDLGYGRWHGKLDANGNPTGYGTMEYNTDHQLNKNDSQKRMAHAGDVVEGDFKNGDMVQGSVNGKLVIIGG